MGSKKALGQAKRAWEQQIQRPLEAVHITEEWLFCAMTSGSAMQEVPAIAAALAMHGWSQHHRTIYAVDTDLREELTRSGLPEESVPTNILRRLPHECPMFVLDDPVLIHHEDFDCLYGQFIVMPVTFGDDYTMSSATLDTCNALRIVWFGVNVEDRYDYGITTQTIELKDNSLDLNEQLAQVMADHAYDGDDGPLPEHVLARRDANWSTTVSSLFPVAVMTVLYACSDEPDFLDIEAPQILKSRGSFKGDRLKVRQVGLRIGTALRSHRNASSSSTGIPTGTVTPHVRRAHWHRFWVGPRNGPRRLTLKWLPPIPVNVDRGPIDATVRPLRESA